MNFDIIVGNPPYGVKKQGTRNIHFNIAKTSLDFVVNNGIMSFIMPAKCVYDTNMYSERKMLRNSGCENIEVLENTNDIFKTSMSVNVGIYRFIKNSKNYDKKLEEEYIDSLYDEPTKIYMRIMNTGDTMFNSFNTTLRNKERTESALNDFLNSMDKEYYFDINFASGSFNNDKKIHGDWISGKSLKRGIQTIEQEKQSLIDDKSCRRIFGFNEDERTYAENLRNAMMRPLLKFGLWLQQDDQNMNSKVYKYFPKIQWEKVFTDEDILKQVGANEDEIKIVLDYVNNFDFSQIRNDRFLKGEEQEDDQSPSPSTSESLPKTIYGLELKRLDPSSDIPEDEKYKEEDLKKAYQ